MSSGWPSTLMVWLRYIETKRKQWPCSMACAVLSETGRAECHGKPRPRTAAGYQDSWNWRIS